MFNRSLYNIILVSLGFLLNQSAFNSILNAQEYIMDEIKNYTDTYRASGYLGNCISFAVLAVGNCVVPPLVSFMGARLTMFVGMFLYFLFVVQFLTYIDWLFYFGCVLSGFGGALMWIAQGDFITHNSTDQTINRNTGIFWAIFQLSAIFGNLYFLLVINNDVIGKESMDTMFITMSAAAGIAALIMLMLIREMYKGTKQKAAESIERFIKLFFTRDMLLLSITFFYTGLEFSLDGGIYGNTMAFTKNFNTKATTLIGIAGIIIGSGEVVGGILFGLFGYKTIRWGHYPIVIFGFVMHMIALTLITLNHPNAAVSSLTTDNAIIESNVKLAYFTCFLLGFGDSCYITQIYCLLGSVYAEQSVAAFTIFNFVRSVASSLQFAITYLGLYRLMGIMYAVCIVGTISFCVVEIIGNRRKSATRSPVSSDILLTLSNKDLIVRL